MSDEYPEGQVSITFMSGPWDGKTLTWDFAEKETETVLTIGRRDGCDVVLDYDTQVSRLHARVIFDWVAGTFFLEDAGSRNGTFIGTGRIRGRTPLPLGELFRVGRTWLRLDPPRGAPEEIDDEVLPF